MQALDFIETARHLTTSSSGRPRQSDLRRAVSTAYYALFHCLAICCANMLVGGPGASRSEAAWRQAYRALNHGAKKRCAPCTAGTVRTGRDGGTRLSMHPVAAAGHHLDEDRKPTGSTSGGASDSD